MAYEGESVPAPRRALTPPFVGRINTCRRPVARGPVTAETLLHERNLVFLSADARF